MYANRCQQRLKVIPSLAVKAQHALPMYHESSHSLPRCSRSPALFFIHLDLIHNHHPSLIVCPHDALAPTRQPRAHVHPTRRTHAPPVPLSPQHPNGGPPLRCVPTAHPAISTSLRRAAADRDAADGHRDGAVAVSNHVHGPAKLRGGTYAWLGQLQARGTSRRQLTPRATYPPPMVHMHDGLARSHRRWRPSPLTMQVKGTDKGGAAQSKPL